MAQSKTSKMNGKNKAGTQSKVKSAARSAKRGEVKPSSATKKTAAATAKKKAEAKAALSMKEAARKKAAAKAQSAGPAKKKPWGKTVAAPQKRPVGRPRKEVASAAAKPQKGKFRQPEVATKRPVGRPRKVEPATKPKFAPWQPATAKKPKVAPWQSATAKKPKAAAGKTPTPTKAKGQGQGMTGRTAAAARKPAPAKKTTEKRPSWMPAGGGPLMSPLFHVADVTRTVKFYEDVLGFILGSTNQGQGGRIDHAVLSYHGSTLMISGPDERHPAGDSASGNAPSLYLYVQDVDDAVARATDHGAEVLEAPQDTFWGDRCSLIRTTDGHQWVLSTHTGAVRPQEPRRSPESSAQAPIEVESIVEPDGEDE